jgi:hypothetical protein
MPVETVAHPYIEAPLHGPPMQRAPAPRTLFVSHVGGATMVRSSNPKGYLMPDVDWPASGVWVGTVGSNPMTVGLEPGGLTVRLFAADEVAMLISQALEVGGLRCLAVGDYQQGIGQLGPAAGVTGLPAAIEPGSVTSDQLEELPALLLPNTMRVPPSDALALRSDAERRADATVAEIATRIAELSGLSDRELAGLFRVARETFQRWRTGELTNPTRGNRRRLGLLLRLVEDLDRRGVEVRHWLRNVSTIDAMTPYDLLERGRLDDVEYLASQMPSEHAVQNAVGGDDRAVTRGSELPGFAHRRDEPSEDLVFDDDGDWIEVDAEAADDDE